MIAGGGRTAEVLDVTTGTSEVIATFDGRGSFATINRLASGALLVVGGYDDQIRLRQDTRVISVDGL